MAAGFLSGILRLRAPPRAPPGHFAQDDRVFLRRGASVAKPTAEASSLDRFLFAEKSNPARRRRAGRRAGNSSWNRRAEPHGQRSFRPSFSRSSLSPWTTRNPRFTCVSDGNPLRRLLVRSKKGDVLIWLS